MSSIELKYAPRKCKYFCCGDCCHPDVAGEPSCGTDYDYCEIAKLRIQKNKKTNNFRKFKKMLKAGAYMCHYINTDSIYYNCMTNALMLECKFECGEISFKGLKRYFKITHNKYYAIRGWRM